MHIPVTVFLHVHALCAGCLCMRVDTDIVCGHGRITRQDITAVDLYLSDILVLDSQTLLARYVT